MGLTDDPRANMAVAVFLSCCLVFGAILYAIDLAERIKKLIGPRP